MQGRNDARRHGHANVQLTTAMTQVRWPTGSLAKNQSSMPSSYKEEEF